MLQNLTVISPCVEVVVFEPVADCVSYQSGFRLNYRDVVLTRGCSGAKSIELSEAHRSQSTWQQHVTAVLETAIPKFIFKASR